MNILKNLFGGGGGNHNAPKDDGIYVYVRPRGCEEVVQIRLHPGNDLSRSEDGSGYFVQKTARGSYRCFNPIEMTLYFDGQRNLSNHEIKGGDLVDESEYHAWQETLAARKAAIREKNAAVDAANADAQSDMDSEGE